MDNNTNEKFAALPERLFILHEGKISYLGGVGPFFYSLESLQQRLVVFERDAKRSAFKMFKYSQKNQTTLPARED